MNRNFTLTIIFFILTVLNIYAAGNKQTAAAPRQTENSGQFSPFPMTIEEPPVTAAQSQAGTSADASFEAAQNISPLPQPAEPTRAELVMKALAQGYPRQIESVEFRNGDWAVFLRDKWYYYSNGRLLPEDLLSEASSYSSASFYNYPRELPQWTEPTAEESSRYRTMTANRSQNPLRRSPHFYDDLWRAHSHEESYDRVKSIRFLGRPIMVHYLILEVLSLVEEEIYAHARTDQQVQAWINNIDILEGWNWRNIAETQSRSFHSYGVAVDIIPRALGGRQTYWLWTSWWRTDWWNTSYSERYHPPDSVIKTFEKYGFAWGGKWTLYDTMHFEYRPEILILSGMPPETRR